MLALAIVFERRENNCPIFRALFCGSWTLKASGIGSCFPLYFAASLILAGSFPAVTVPPLITDAAAIPLPTRQVSPDRPLPGHPDIDLNFSKNA